MARMFNKLLIIFLLLKLFENQPSLAFEDNNNQRNKLFFLQRSPKGDNEILLKVIWRENKEPIFEGCKIYTKKAIINRVLESSKDSPIQILPESEMQNILEDCKEFNIRKSKCKEGGEDHDKVSSDDILNSSQTSATYPETQLIFPGTKWCGVGNIAEDYDDLGTNEDIDRCCRAHDNCDDYLNPGESRGNLTNTSWFTALSCECDRELYHCLSNVNSTSSYVVLYLYFDVLKKECFTLDYPLMENCKTYYTFLKIKCVEYERNTTASKVYQWVPAKKYIDNSVPLTTEPF